MGQTGGSARKRAPQFGTAGPVTQTGGVSPAASLLGQSKFGAPTPMANPTPVPSGSTGGLLSGAGQSSIPQVAPQDILGLIRQRFGGGGGGRK